MDELSEERLDTPDSMESTLEILNSDTGSIPRFNNSPSPDHSKLLKMLKLLKMERKNSDFFVLSSWKINYD